MDFMSEEIPLKLIDTKIFLRMGPDDKPQVVRMEPAIGSDQTFNPDIVYIYLDDDTEPTIFDRESANLMLLSSESIPIETILNYKHRIKH